MQAVGMVVEYNPFHNGHHYFLRQAKAQTEADVAVAVMSGNFTQRGEPTIVDKWTRAQAALESGVDLVVELPVFYAAQPAHRFAAGALAILNALQVHQVAFGAEHPQWDFAALVAAEQHFNQAEFDQYNATYATQFNQQLRAQTGIELRDPNDILAFAYTKAVLANDYPIQLTPVQRRGSDYHDQQIHGQIASASAIRQAVTTGGDFAATVPPVMDKALAKVDVVPSWDSLYPILRNQLIQAPIDYLAQTYQMAEGLEHRMKEVAQRSLCFDEFIYGVKTKRYTYAHLLRMCLYTTLQLSENEVAARADHPYIHILGFTARGREYLHQVKKQVPIPLFTKVSQGMRDGFYNLDYRAGKLYQNFTTVEQDLKHPPIMIH
ncbi:MAG: nucleotidyltransferase [Lactobacillaceae bacterium]|nr:nucleotidyltransferase [Lactobacillaceae bacterium]